MARERDMKQTRKKHADRVTGSHDFLRLMEFYPRLSRIAFHRPAIRQRTADSG
jgi:hypothetical protein